MSKDEPMTAGQFLVGVIIFCLALLALAAVFGEVREELENRNPTPSPSASVVARLVE